MSAVNDHAGSEFLSVVVPNPAAATTDLTTTLLKRWEECKRDDPRLKALTERGTRPGRLEQVLAYVAQAYPKTTDKYILVEFRDLRDVWTGRIDYFIKRHPELQKKE